jgi:hypothetical protein
MADNLHLLQKPIPRPKVGQGLMEQFVAVKEWGIGCKRQGVQENRVKEKYSCEKAWLWTIVGLMWRLIVALVGDATVAEELLFTLVRPFFSRPGEASDTFHMTMFKKVTNISDTKFLDLYQRFNNRHQEYKAGED